MSKEKREFWFEDMDNNRLASIDIPRGGRRYIQVCLSHPPEGESCTITMSGGGGQLIFTPEKLEFAQDTNCLKQIVEVRSIG